MNRESAEFWSLLEESGLLPRKRVASLRKQVEQKASIAESPERIARVLVSNQVLEESQVRQLLSRLNTTADTAADATATAPSSNTSPVRSKSRRKSNLYVALTITAAIFFGVAACVWFALNSQNSDATNPESTAATTSSDGNSDAKDARTSDSDSTSNSYYDFVDDDDALWARPQPGDAIELEFAPAGVQTIIRIRLRDLLRHQEGTKILRSLGPGLEELRTSWLAKLGIDAESIETLDLYFLPQGTTYPQVVAVGRITESSASQFQGGFRERDSDGVAKLGADSIWFPQTAEPTFVFGPSSVIKSMVSESKDNEHIASNAVLRRELEQLRRATHDTDHVNVLANPNFFRDEAQDLFPGLRRRLLDGLFDFWSQEAQAVSWGIQLSDVTVAEVRMIAREDLPPRRLLGRVDNFIGKLPSSTSDFLGRAQLDPYWQPLALRLPTMLQFLAKQARTGIDGKQVIINVSLPVEAIHNLALATELSSLTPTTQASSIPTVDRSNWTLDDVMAYKTSIRFSQKSLEQAMRDVEQQVEDELRDLPFSFAIEIVGTDLELDGITRNQQIRDFNVQDASLADILTGLVAKANPTPNVSTNHPDQKLVWVPEIQTGSVLITTRSAAKSKNLPLPRDFVLD